MKTNSIAKKIEYITDTFQGTCELNNYSLIKVPILDGENNIRKTQIKELTKLIEQESLDKVFFYGPVFDNKETIELGALSAKSDTYRDGELINMAVKFLDNLGLEEITVDIKGDEELIENLETLDIVTTCSDEIISRNDDVVYEIYVEDEVVIKGISNREKSLSYFTIDFDNLLKRENYIIENVTLDAYIKPESEGVKSDAFVIASNLKDAGFKVEVDYYNKNDNPNSAYLITFNSNDIKNYRVKITDTKTNETQEIDIDSIIEVLAFM